MGRISRIHTDRRLRIRIHMAALEGAPGMAWRRDRVWAGINSLFISSYLLLLLISGIVSLIYLIAAGAIVSDFGIEIEYSSQISQLMVSAALLVANYIYFQKRSNLFVN